ncbi:UNVERIFIED_CONTAM: hypothetical protein PYX00_007475 [Menopon gallinae]|uniref:Cytochrome P450 n=1 Tax=Menopon gallinae TaxID=328185 RepID=A0AAW2HJR3_9NEOP
MYQYIIFCALVLYLFHTLVYHKYNWPSYVRMINKIPGPKGVLFFGSTLKYYRLKHEELLPDMLKDLKTWGPTFRYWYSGVAVVIVSDIDDIQTILTSRQSYRKGIIYKNIKPWLGTGLLISTGQKWHTMRKIITPTFHFSILQEYVHVFNKNTKIMVKLLEECDKEDCDLNGFITYCALDSICETSMGTFLNSQRTKAESEYVQAIFGIGKIIVERMFSPFLFSDRNFKMSSLGREQAKLLKILHGFTSKIIEEKKQAFEKTETEERDPDQPKKISFLEMLLEKQKTHFFSDTDIREEVDTFLMAGHDTTAAALTWAFFELGHRHDIQDKVYEEMRRIFGDSDRSPTYQDLMEMSYLKRVLQETLRIYPSVPVISRKFDSDIQLKNYVVPARTEMVLVIYSIHRNPDIYPDPEKFDPDRFLPEESEKRHTFAYVPFSAGQRNCVGQKYAMLQMLVLASSILRRYKIISLDDRESVKPLPDVILRPNKKLKWRIIPRNSIDKNENTLNSNF